MTTRPRALLSRLRAKRVQLAALAAMGALYAFSYFHRVAVPGTVFNEIQSDLLISAGAVTGLGAVLLYIYGGAQVFVGALTDRFGGMRVLLVGGVLMSAGGVIFPLSHSLWMLYGSRALVGLGASVMYLCAVKELDTLFGAESFAPLLCVLIFIGYGGGLIGTYPFERAVSMVGWRWSLLGAGIASWLVLGCVYLLLRRFRDLVSTGTPFSAGPLIAICRDVHVYPVIVSGVINWSIYFLIQTQLGKKFLQDFVGIDSGGAALFTFAMMVTAMTSVLFSGILSRAIGNRRKPLLIGGATITLLATVLLVLGIRSEAPGRLFLVGYVMLAFSCGTAAIFCSSMKELGPPGAVGLSVGVLNGFCYLGAAVVANAAGMALDLFEDRATNVAGAMVYPADAYEVIFWGMSALAALSLVVCLMVKETRGQQAHGWSGEWDIAP